jgi:hypothetical protein
MTDPPLTKDDIDAQCGWCNAVRIAGVWFDYPQKIAGTSHGICPTCLPKLYKQWGMGTPSPSKNPRFAGRGEAMEFFKLTGHHVMTGKKLALVFMLTRRRNQRPIDVILANYDLGGVHVTKVVKMRMSRVKPVALISSTFEK